MGGSDHSPLILFVDTNFFLQLKPPQDIPWDTAFPMQDVILMVPRTVQKEISRLKGDGNSRRAKRARSAASRLFRIAEAEECREVIRDSRPTVQLQLPGPIGRTSGSFPDPELGSADDRILDEVLRFREGHPGENVAFLTTDSDQVVSCKYFGLPFYRVPEDWHLPPEPDERDKRIRELERRIGRLEDMEPKVRVHWADDQGVPISTCPVTIDEYAQLSPDLIDELVAEAQRRSPRVEGLDELVGANRPRDPILAAMIAARPWMRFIPPTLEEIANYHQRQYPQWLQRLREFIANLPKRTTYPSRFKRITLILQNDGTRPAEGLQVMLTGLGGVQLVRKERETEPSAALEFPSPPRPPKGSYEDQIGTLAPTRPLIEPYDFNPGRFTPPQFDPHDEYAFYLIEGSRDKPDVRWVFACDFFQHGGHQQRIDVTVFVPEGARLTNTAIHCNVLARNMSEPIKSVIEVTPVFRSIDCAPAARELIEKNLLQTAKFEIVEVVTRGPGAVATNEEGDPGDT